MNVRFSEPCRTDPLNLKGTEGDVEIASIQDGRDRLDHQLECETDIHIGVFFDGTNNNKYRDTPNFAHSNVARLYEVYPGRREGTASAAAGESGWLQDCAPGLGTPTPDVGNRSARTGRFGAAWNT